MARLPPSVSSLSASVGSGMQAALGRRQQKDIQISSLYGRTFELFGQVDVIGTGEVLYHVNFPVQFIEQPHITGGGALAEGQVLVPGLYPTWNVGAGLWTTKVINTGTIYYLGADLVLVSTGSGVDQLSTFHFRIAGRALVNPVDPDPLAT